VTLTIGIDVGGTKVLGAVVDVTGEVLAQTRRPTPAQDTSGIVAGIVDTIEELAAEHDVEGVGIGAAGWIDAKRSTVLFAPNLAWRNVPLRDRVSAAVGLPVVVENDGNAAAWAEFTFGAARDADDSMALFTVGTGIGGGIVLGGELVRGAHGIAAELGHIQSVPGGRICGCGRLGCVEQYASGNALIRFAQQVAIDDPGSAKHLLSLTGGSVEAIDGPTVTRAAQAGDPAAVSAFDQIAMSLAGAMADLVQVLDPQVIVIGGGVVEAGDLLVVPAREHFHHELAQRGRLPVAEVRPALMGNQAGVIGAADLGRRL
jgi:glucokinase